MNKTEVNDAVPTKLDEVVGQKAVVQNVAVELQAAKCDNRKYCSTILLGSPGTGKSLISQIIATEKGVNFTEVLGQSIKTQGDLNSLLLKAKDKDVIFFEEAHFLSNEYQTALYLAMDKKKITVSTGKSVVSLPIADITFLFATTEEYLLLQPLKDRSSILRFAYNSLTELEEIVKRRAESLNWKIDSEILPEISKRSRATARWALRYLSSGRRVCRSENRSTITHKHIIKAFELEGIDSLGFGRMFERLL